MICFTSAFEPGNGTVYRVLFGRLPASHPLFTEYVLFGISEGSDAMITVVFPHMERDLIREDTFYTQWETAQFVSTVDTPVYIAHIAYTVFAHYLGYQPSPPRGWKPNWSASLPVFSYNPHM